MQKKNEEDNPYKLLLSKMIDLYQKLDSLFLINLNDVFKAENLNFLKKDQLINDTISLLQNNNYDINALLQASYTNSNNNLFIEYSIQFDSLINDPLIEKQFEEINCSNLPKKKKNLFKQKKNHEVKQLANFFEQTNVKDKYEVFLEMGCGNLYLSEAILTEYEKKILYIGIDMKENLIEKKKEMIEQKQKDNVFVLNTVINAKKFPEFYQKEIYPILKAQNKENKNMFLFGLHACGNLTSDTLKIFVKENLFEKLAVVGCCLNLLTEYISPQAKNTQKFKNYYNQVGFDSKGNFLENTIKFEYDENEIGYPLSNFIRKEYPQIFMTRSVRNSAMQKNCNVEPISSVNHKKIFYRALLQSLFEKYIPLLSNTYGFGKIFLEENENFKEYVIKAFDLIKKNNFGNDINLCVDSCCNNLENVLEDFFRDFNNEDRFLWAVDLIRMKFSKLIEYMIALDRVVYLIENGIKNVRIIKIFNDRMSTRNILIYASKA